MKVKVSEASGATLDWMVAKCEGKHGDCEIHAGNLLYGRATSGFIHYRPSSDWAQGGPLIEREKIDTRWVESINEWHGDLDSECESGPTPLIAAMRCFCISKLGEEVEVPDELAGAAA